MALYWTSRLYNENKTVVKDETIVASENEDTYLWVLRGLHSIETCWIFCKLMIICFVERFEYCWFLYLTW